MKKEWNNPELNELDAVKTYDEGGYGCTCTVSAGLFDIATIDHETTHYCHRKNSHKGDHKPGDSHWQSVGCPEHGSSCCCYGGNQHS